jgi:predicted membrane channel-forming protein YqfA (hemolysin III family)
MDKHDFSYVLFSAALGAFGVFLIAAMVLEDRILMIIGGVCLGLMLVASIVYMIHLVRGPKYEPRLDENGNITYIWCLKCMRSNHPKRSHCKNCGRPIK